MKLLGHYLSPYTRRVAVSLNALDIPFVHEQLSVVMEPERVRPHNPVLRIPTLLLDDGEPLIESWAILDTLDQMAGPERALVPPSGVERRRVMQLTALAVASMEKAQWGYYERRFHPAEKVHQPWIDHNDGQCLGGLRKLEGVAVSITRDAWLAGTRAMTQADISTAVFVSWMIEARPEYRLPEVTPHLCRFAARLEELPPFCAAQMPASATGRPGVWLPKT